MKGKVHVIIQNRRVKYEFDIIRNITIIRGDSGTGKTTLFNLISTYERLGQESGIIVSCEKNLKTLNNESWNAVVENNHECIIFADEETKVIKTHEFAQKIRNSDNYYVLITRESLPSLPYSVQEVYGIHVSGKYVGLKQTYNCFYHLYGYNNEKQNTEMVIVEDTNSGYDFFKSIVRKDITCISAEGKNKI